MFLFLFVSLHTPLLLLLPFPLPFPKSFSLALHGSSCCPSFPLPFALLEGGLILLGFDPGERGTEPATFQVWTLQGPKQFLSMVQSLTFHVHHVCPDLLSFAFISIFIYVLSFPFMSFHGCSLFLLLFLASSFPLKN